MHVCRYECMPFDCSGGQNKPGRLEAEGDFCLLPSSETEKEGG